MHAAAEDVGRRADDERLGALLVREGYVSADDLATAVRLRGERGHSLTRVMLDERVLSEDDLATALATLLRLERIDLTDYPIDAAAARLVGQGLARRHHVIPVGWQGGRLIVAMADPGNVFAIDDVRAVTAAEVLPVIATRSEIIEAIGQHHRADAHAEDITAQAASSFQADQGLNSVREVFEDGPIVKLVNMLIGQATLDRASDIHVEPGERDVRIRYRIDGVLHEVMRAPKTIQGGITSRLKVMADINIAERRIPQDGRITTSIEGRTMDLRVATLPTVWGEKVVMRILDKSNALLRLSDLGFHPENLTRYEKSFKKPYGTILVTGPTGSGKSTTLYATLNIISQPSLNVITVEDPVEYQLPGINQVQVNTKAGLTFASALRSILRSDPDVLLVGEIRDRETAIIAVEAALTGHLVLSTLHTNDASTTAGRLIEMGVEPFLVGSSLDCIVAQRLARRLCERCREPYQPTRAELETINWDFELLGGYDELPTLYRPKGCGVCGRTGYQGRFAIHEVLQVTEEIERIIVERGHAEDIRKASISRGMMTLRQAGMVEVRSGKTAVEEILRVIV